MKKMFVLLTVTALCFAGCKSAVEDVGQVETQGVTQGSEAETQGTTDLRNNTTNEAGLFTDSQTYGAASDGTEPAGSPAPANATNENAVGIGNGNSVYLTTIPQEESAFTDYSKHKQGKTGFAQDSDSSPYHP